MEPSEHTWSDLGADIELLGGDSEKRARVAITSYEFVGVVRNGGIGTASTELALALAREGHEVDLFFTGAGAGDEDDEGAFEHWRNHYKTLGVSLDRVPPRWEPEFDFVVHSASHSLALYRALAERDRQRPYDAIHFVESLGHGFYSLLAKRQGFAFGNATTVVNTHSPRRWLAEAHALPFDHPVELSDEFLENRCLELADVVVSPSAHVLSWLRDRGVSLPQRSYVQQYVTDFDRQEASPPAPAPVEELVFFGRLEARKGIFAFCDALDLLAGDGSAGLERVTFLGKESVSRDYLEERAAAWPWRWEVVSDLDRDAALDYLSAPGRLAVMASTMDNSPNVVYEALGLGLAFLASRGGGTGELVHPDDFERVTYDPRDPELREVDPADPARTRPVHSGRVLAERLRTALAAEPRPARFAVPPDRNRETHLAWHRTIAARAANPAPDSTELPEPRAVGDLPSPGAGEELLLLIDAGVELMPEARAELGLAAAASPASDFLTPLCSFEGEVDDEMRKRTFLPTGGPAAMGLFGNCAGAGVALARRAALEEMGVLAAPDQAPAGVAELLARAALAGRFVDVVPAVLCRLPASAVGEEGDSVSRGQGAVELMRPYSLELSPETYEIAACAARFYREEPLIRAAANEAAHHAALYAELFSRPGARAGRALRHPVKALRRLAGGRAS